MGQSNVSGNSWDNRGPKGMKFHSDVMRQDLTQRAKDAGMDYNVSSKPAVTGALTVFKRGEAFNANPGHDEKYGADFPVGEGKGAKGVFYEGELSVARHRTVGLVNELIESHTQHQNALQTQGSANLRPLTVDEQQQKLEEMQRALLEEAAFLDRLKKLEVEHPLICETCTGDRDKSLLGGCVRIHYPCIEIDRKELGC